MKLRIFSISKNCIIKIKKYYYKMQIKYGCVGLLLSNETYDIKLLTFSDCVIDY